MNETLETERFFNLVSKISSPFQISLMLDATVLNRMTKPVIVNLTLGQDKYNFLHHHYAKYRRL